MACREYHSNDKELSDADIASDPPHDSHPRKRSRATSDWEVANRGEQGTLLERD